MSAILQDQDTAAKTWFSQLFHTYQRNLNGHRTHPLSQFRIAAFEAFSQEDFPTRFVEDWKYSGAIVGRTLETNYQAGKAVSLTKGDLDQAMLKDIDALKLVFVNGVLQEELSNYRDAPEGLQIETVSKAIEDAGNREWMEAQVAQKGGTANNTFLTLNRAFAQNGVFVKTAKNQQFTRPIHCVYLNTRALDPHFSHPQLFIWAASGSEVTVIESHQSLVSDAAYFTNVANYVDVGANAQVHHYKLQTESKAALHINNTIARQDRDSTYSAYAIDLGGKTVRNNLSTELTGSGTQTNMYGVYLGNGQQHIDNQTFIDHATPHCQSNEMYKGILTDYARGVFNGKVLVRQDAQKINAYQQNSSLVLSPNAIMDAKPQLEIFADDVRCSHGATIGQLDEGSIFYLRSRGLSLEQAKGLLQQAFLGEVIENFPSETIQEWARASIHTKLSNV